MPRPLDRPATLAAAVNALVVYLLPLAFAGMVAMFAADYSNHGTRVVGIDPDRAAVWARRLSLVTGYLATLSVFAAPAAVRTFVHARRWLESGRSGVQGILEAGLCGFGGALVVLMPGIMTRPTEAPPYVIAYGGFAAVLGLGVGVVLWLTATVVLWLYSRAGDGANAMRASQ